jgi:hypothetical protein
MPDRHQYVEKLKAKLDEWDRELATFEDRARSASDDVKKRSHLALADLMTARQQLSHSLTEIVDASDDAWQALRLSMDRAWDNVRTGLLAARSEMLPPQKKTGTDVPEA